MVMNSTSTVATSIQAVSPPFKTASSAMAKPGTRDKRAPSPAIFRRVIGVTPGAWGSQACLDRVGIGFAGTDADRLLQVDDENLAVTDLAGVGGLGDGFDDAIQLIVSDGHVNLYLG